MLKAAFPHPPLICLLPPPPPRPAPVSNWEAVSYIREGLTIGPGCHSLIEGVSGADSLLVPSMFFIAPHIFPPKWLPSGRRGTFNPSAAGRRQKEVGTEGTGDRRRRGRERGGGGALCHPTVVGGRARM